jgi:hypothetical protein
MSNTQASKNRKPLKSYRGKTTDYGMNLADFHFGSTFQRQNFLNLGASIFEQINSD